MKLKLFKISLTITSKIKNYLGENLANDFPNSRKKQEEDNAKRN